MKSTYIIILAIIVVGGLMWFNLPPKEAVAPIVETPPVQTEGTSTAQDMGMTEEEHRQMTPPPPAGNDIGMEMPIMDSDLTAGAVGGEKMFMVNGTNFAFDVKEIRVQEGDTVTIHFMSEDGFHDLVIDEFNVHTEKLKTGGMAMATFVANKKGTFEYYCSVGQHRMNGMVGKLIVE